MKFFSADHFQKKVLLFVSTDPENIYFNLDKREIFIDYLNSCDIQPLFEPQNKNKYKFHNI